jgi:hypothetical protein
MTSCRCFASASRRRETKSFQATTIPPGHSSRTNAIGHGHLTFYAVLNLVRQQPPFLGILCHLQRSRIRRIRRFGRAVESFQQVVVGFRVPHSAPTRVNVDSLAAGDHHKMRDFTRLKRPGACSAGHLRPRCNLRGARSGVSASKSAALRIHVTRESGFAILKFEPKHCCV